jgi:predicted ATPase
MQAARPGEILVSDEARARASDAFIWETLPSVRVKGKSEPVALNRLIGLKTQQAVRSLETLYPLPIVGRQVTFDQMAERLTALLAGQGQVVCLVGEAGMGKSHLAADFSRQVRAQGARLALGVCQSISRNTPYRPWRDIFATLLGLENKGEAEAVSHLTSFFAEQHPEWALRLPLLADLLALPIPDNPTTAALDSDLRQQSLFSLLVEMVKTFTRPGPLVLVVENAHWLDEASLALTQTLAQQAAGVAPVMLLLLNRPASLGDAPLLPALATLTYYTELVLDEMPDEAVAALIQRRLGAPPSPLLLAIVQTMARGNPFFVGELLEAMRQDQQLVQDEDGAWRVADALLGLLQRANFVVLADGAWQLKPDADLSAVRLGIPDSIHGLILSRLDRLPEPHKLTLKVSSVVGHTIDLALVAQVHPEAKAVPEIQAEAEYMAAEEVVHEEMPAARIYAFRHHTTQEVAYETLLYTQRQHLHRALAEALAAQQPEAVTPIAHHAFLGQAWSLALAYNLLAGEQAKQLHANQQSIDFLQKALISAEALANSQAQPAADTAEQRKRIHLALGELFVSASQYESANEHLKVALSLARSQSDREAEACCCRWIGRSHELRGEYTLALTWLDKGFAALNGHTSTEEAELSLIAGLINIRQGNYDQALHLCRRSLQVGQALANAAIRARTYNLMGIVDLRQNRTTAIERFQQSLAQYEQLSNVYGQATSHNLIANWYFARGEWSRSDFHYRRSLDMFTQIGSAYNQVLVNNNLGGIALKQGRLEAALGYYQRAVRLLEQTGGSLWVFGALHLNMGHAYIRRQETAPAAEQLQLAQAYFDQARVRDLLPELYGLLAELAQQQGDLVAAENHGQHSLALARELAMPLEEGRALRILGEIAHAGQRLAPAEQNLRQSYTILRQAADEYESARTHLSLARLYAAQGDVAQAEAALALCEEAFGHLGAELDLAIVRQLQQP